MYLLFSIFLILGAICALYNTIRLLHLNGISGGVEDNIPLIGSVIGIIVMPIFSYGFYKAWSEYLTIYQVFGS